MPWKKIKSPGLAELFGIMSHTPIKPFAVKRPTLQPLQDLNVDTVRQDIPTSSAVTDVTVWEVEQAGTDDFTVVYSVDQTVTEGEQSARYTSAYMVVVHVDGDGNMVITQNPTISSMPHCVHQTP